MGSMATSRTPAPTPDPSGEGGGMMHRFTEAISGLAGLVVPGGFRGETPSPGANDEHVGFHCQHTANADNAEAEQLGKIQMLSTGQISRAMELVARGVGNWVHILANVGWTKHVADYISRKQEFAADQRAVNDETTVVHQTNFFQQLATTFKRLIGVALRKMGVTNPTEPPGSGSDPIA